jgi:hypothetical protein
MTHSQPTSSGDAAGQQAAFQKAAFDATPFRDPTFDPTQNDQVQGHIVISTGLGGGEIVPSEDG